MTPSPTTRNHKGGIFVIKTPKNPVAWFLTVAVACCLIGLLDTPEPSLEDRMVPATSVVVNQDPPTSNHNQNEINPDHGGMILKKNSRRHLQSTDDGVLVASKVGPTSTSEEWQNDYNVVHVVNTRFMQHQANLLHLGKARLDLFQTFTVPSMLQQTNQQFLWLIWVDEFSDLDLRQEFLEQVSQFPNAIVLGGGEIPSYDGHSNLRNLYESSWTVLTDAVLAGNRLLLADYYKASQTHILLETRLDADDALSKTFIESAQSLAASSLGQEEETSNRMIEYFCPEHHAEWRYLNPDNDKEQDSTQNSGHLIHFHDKEFCINTGLTTVFHLKFRDMRKLQVANCNIGYGGGGPCPPIYTRRRQLQGGSNPVNGRPSVPGNNSMCTPRNIPDGIEQTVVLGNPNTCPTGSMLCAAVSMGPGNVTGGVSILPEWLDESADCGADNEAISVQCIPVGCTRDTVVLRVCVEERKRNGEITKLQISSGPDYKLTEVYMKAASGAGGLTHNWIDGDVTPPIVGGVFSDVFATPFVPKTYTRYGLFYADICVAPHDTGHSCRRRIGALPDDENSNSRIQSVLPSVLMARTPTAAGMKHVLPDRKKSRSKTTNDKSMRMNTFESNQAHAWELMHREFGVDNSHVSQLRERFEENMEAILIDAFAGQCTPGHSCKESTKRALGHLLNKLQHRNNHMKKAESGY